jgi:arylsulfatase A-like enzyme
MVDPRLATDGRIDHPQERGGDLDDPDSIPIPTTSQLPQGCPEFAGHTNGELHSYPGVPAGNPIPAEFAKTLRHGYYACISYMDAQVGRLLDALDEQGLADNTIIVLWGDHGWQLGDHGLWHKHTNFEIAARAPLLISLPKSRTIGQKCQAPVEFVDVFPTLTDLCGLPTPEGLAGQSLRTYIENPKAPMQKVAISQYPRNSLMGYSIRNERWRATFWRERSGSRIEAIELYDELNDPTETVSLHDQPEHKPLLETLVQLLPPVGSATVVKKPKAEKPTASGINASATTTPERMSPRMLENHSRR